MKTLSILFSIFICTSLFSQEESLIDFDQLENEPVYESMEEALSDPENVIRLDLSKQKIHGLDYDFRKLVNLQWLDLSKNEFQSFPKELTECTKLQYLNLAKNDIDVIPDEIGNLVHLKELAMSKNRIYLLSPEMGKCTKLERIDLWDNPIKSFPEELRYMKSLKHLDLRVTVINEKEKKKLMKMFPDTEIKFSKTCNCN